jgi:hypothetical protein
MIAAYQDRFRALPGDDGSAVAHLGATAAQAKNAAGQTISDGLIGGTFDSTDATSESVIMWQHLRLANLVAGDATDPSKVDLTNSNWRYKNAEGGVVGVQSANPLAAGTAWSGRQFICQQNVSGRIALQVDTTMDDGNPSTGSVRFGTWASPTLTPATLPDNSGAAGTFDENKLYTVCASF